MHKSSFFDMASGKQVVNQWLCIAFIAVFCFWTVVYYVAEKAAMIGENLSSSVYDSAR
ncbi:MAG: hypothetical protein AB197_00125 [Parcubacteria bacterium C7867-002]|nr:MAG: hypothetical protein AB197_00125 [Parcubacteria bacterium C7867-002]